jgi:hypothetical protein
MAGALFSRDWVEEEHLLLLGACHVFASMTPCDISWARQKVYGVWPTGWPMWRTLKLVGGKAIVKIRLTIFCF